MPEDNRRVINNLLLQLQRKKINIFKEYSFRQKWQVPLLRATAQDIPPIIIKVIYDAVCSSGKFFTWANKHKAPGI